MRSQDTARAWAPLPKRLLQPLLRRAGRCGCLGLLLAQVALAGSQVTPVPSTQAGTLPLEGQGTATERIVKVADLDITSDSALGYTLTVSSGSLGKGDALTPIPFQVVAVEANAPAPARAAFTTPSGSAYVYTSTATGAHTLQLYIRYVAAEHQDPGAYQASVSVSVVDN